jgi:hypothetical protein
LLYKTYRQLLVEYRESTNPLFSDQEARATMVLWDTCIDSKASTIERLKDHSDSSMKKRICRQLCDYNPMSKATSSDRPE